MKLTPSQLAQVWAIFDRPTISKQSQSTTYLNSCRSSRSMAMWPRIPISSHERKYEMHVEQSDPASIWSRHPTRRAGDDDLQTLRWTTSPRGVM